MTPAEALTLAFPIGAVVGPLLYGAPPLVRAVCGWAWRAGGAA